MNKKIARLFLIFLLCLFTSACNEDTVIDRIGAARIQPEITVDPTLIASSGKRNVTPVPDVADLSFSLSADDGKYSHDWESVNDYPNEELLRPGSYTAQAFFGKETDEGFDCPYFYGMKNISLQSGDEIPCEITASLASAVFQTAFSSEILSAFNNVSATFHSAGFSYQQVASGESRMLFLHSGDTEVFLDLTTSDGLQSTLRVATIQQTESRNLYDVSFESDGAVDPTVTLNVNGKEIGGITVTEALLRAPAPEIIPSGFTSGVPINLPEGDISSTPIVFNISGSGISSLVLTSMAPSINTKGWPSKIDLASASDSELSQLFEYGLKITRSSSGQITSIDLTDVVSKLRYSSSSSESSFFLMAESPNGKVSKPCELKIALQPVSINVASVSNVMIGVNLAEIVLLSRTGDLNGNLVIEARNENGAWSTCDIESIDERDIDEYAVRFKAPEGNSEELPVRIIYCGNVLTETTLKRVSPEFTFKADAFALSALLKIESPDRDLIPLITSMAKVYVNGNQAVSVRRVPETGYIYVGNLEPKQNYTLTATLFDSPKHDNFTAPVAIETENTAQPQNNNFEEHGGGAKYNNMPCGGRYSQSILDIFNQQNFTSFDFTEPSYWNSVTPKTFCMAAKNHNTWFMAPSTCSVVDNVEGYFAVRLQSVAWDTTGEEITPYRQKPDQYLNYNPNIPVIKYRAAGKLFLGGYRFDPATLEEHYDEGIPFSSRPAAVNGNYRFTPSPADLSDCGRIIVEVIGNVDGQEEVIASNSVLMQPALTYTAFSVPLTYKYFGVKATKLKIMMSSSRYVGSIEYESSHIKTYSDPVTATSRGGELWVEDLQLSYF